MKRNNNREVGKIAKFADGIFGKMIFQKIQIQKCKQKF